MSAPRIPVADRFWAKVDKSGDCWLWTAVKDGYGYGLIHDYGSRRLKAHRVAYELAHGPIPDGLVIDHMCHTRACVRASHLQAVTNKLNIENRAGVNKNSTSGIRGVSWHKAAGKWHVAVEHNRTRHYGGLFASLAEAEAAAIALRSELFTNNLADRAAS